MSRGRALRPVTEADVPSDTQAEAAMLGACLVGGRQAVERAARIVAASDMHDARHRLIFEAMLGLLRQGAEIDTVTVTAWLRDRPCP